MLRGSLSADRPSTCRRSFGRIVTRKKDLCDPGRLTVAEHVGGGAVGKDKGMLKGKRRINRES